MPNKGDLISLELNQSVSLLKDRYSKEITDNSLKDNLLDSNDTLEQLDKTILHLAEECQEMIDERDCIVGDNKAKQNYSKLINTVIKNIGDLLIAKRKITISEKLDLSHPHMSQVVEYFFIKFRESLMNQNKKDQEIETILMGTISVMKEFEKDIEKMIKKKEADKKRGG